ncbi:MAG: OmpA family protein [Gammaproteobacteria bacterium]|nr:OmpA family protein [Gammaproteobacteria bacterium]
MKIKTLTALILCAATTQVLAHPSPYWSDSEGSIIRDGAGLCLRTVYWTEKESLDSCEGRTAKIAVKPAVAEKKVVAPAEAKAATPQLTKLSLASGATFALGGSTLSAEGKAAVVELMNQFKGETVDTVVIEGYTDDRGAASFNQQLSEKRAEAVKAELVANGANPDKITTIGYGESNPVADNATREGRAKNRRVEITVDGAQRQL